MRIAPVMNYNARISNQFKNRESSIPTKQKEVAFGRIGWQDDVIGILYADSSRMRELGEYFHLCDEATLRDASKVYNFFDFVKKDSSKRAFSRLSTAVREVLKDKNQWLSRIASLSVGEAKNAENIASEKLHVTNRFINMLASGQVDNGILVHGTSREKQSFLDWLFKASDLNIKEMTYRKENPAESFQELVMYAQNAKTAQSINGKRTLLHVNKLDDLLTSFETAAERRNIAKFKSFVEHTSDKYYTTLVTSTEHLLEDFEDASIAPHRFGLKVELNEHLTDAEKKNLAELRGKVKKIEDKASQVRKEFWSDSKTDIYIPLGAGC